MPNADITAYEIAKRANLELGLTEAEIQYVLTIARGEGFYGNGWSPTAATISISQKFGLTGYEGIGSNNWGAEQGAGDAGSFLHVDRHANGKSYVGKYKKWSTPEKGYISLAKTVLSGLKRGNAGAIEIHDAIQRGDLKAAVYAQHANGYFELAPDKYYAIVAKNYETISKTVGWNKLFPKPTTSNTTTLTPATDPPSTGNIITVLTILLITGGIFLRTIR